MKQNQFYYSLMNIKNSFLFLMIFFLAACAPQQGKKLDVKSKYELLSKADATRWVITDESEGFFEKVAPLEMSIQMHQNLEDQPRADVVELYKEMLEKDLEDFTKEERELAGKIIDYAFQLCYKIDPNINLPKINFIKTAGKYYGPGVFYTRDNSIVIPSMMLDLDKDGDNNGFLSTMIHEIFHVYSRYNKDKRDALYKRIGFEKLPNLALSEFLKERVLYNPDGVDLRYAITVKSKTTGKEFKAIPAIYSKFKEYKTTLPAFFGYLTFQLFEVQDRAGMWSVTDKDVGHSIEDLTGFWEQVGENTRYNIHPDEICADNFVILALSKGNKGENLKTLTDEGRQLVKDLEAIIIAK